MRRLYQTFAVVCFTSLPVASQTAGDDSELGKLISTIVVDSLGGGGATVPQAVFAMDSVSRHWLSIAKIDARTAMPTQVMCPGSVRDATTPIDLPAGYSIKVETKRSESEPLRLLISKQCLFHYGGGRTKPFAEGGEWEIERVSGSWKIVRTIDHFIT
jgi:hypothetical protein